MWLESSKATRVVSVECAVAMASKFYVEARYMDITFVSEL